MEALLHNNMHVYNNLSVHNNHPECLSSHMALQHHSVNENEASTADPLVQSKDMTRQRKQFLLQRKNKQSKKRGRITFPQKLHNILEEIERNGEQDIIGWLPDGLSFKVFKPHDFVEVIMPRYFKHSNFRSFQRQVSETCCDGLMFHRNQPRQSSDLVIASVLSLDK